MSRGRSYRLNPHTDTAPCISSLGAHRGAVNTNQIMTSPGTSRGHSLPQGQKCPGTETPDNFEDAAYMTVMPEKKETPTKSETNQRDIALREAWLAGQAARAQLPDDPTALRAMPMRERTTLNRAVRAGEEAYAKLRKLYEGLLVNRADSACHSAANEFRGHLTHDELFAIAEEKFFKLAPKWNPQESTLGYYMKLCIANLLANAVKKLREESQGNLSLEFDDEEKVKAAGILKFIEPARSAEEVAIDGETEAESDAMAALVARVMAELQQQDPTAAAIIRGLEYYDGKKPETAASLAKKLGLENGGRVDYLKKIAKADLRIAIEAALA